PTVNIEERRWELIVLHRERLVRLAYGRMKNLQDAEDCAQEAMLRTASFDHLDEQRVGAFLSATTLRLCVDHYRRAERQLRLWTRMVVTNKSPCPEEIICDQEEGLWMLDQVQQLRGREREVMLAHTDGMSITQTAKQLGISTKAAESALARARKRLQ